MANSQILVLDPPSVLKFKGPYNVVQTVELKLFNPSDDTVLFKIKTTAPKRYCVRPNAGSASPRANITISIMLQPTGSDADNDRSKHKFMVQSLVASPDALPENYDALWKDLGPGQIAETRLKCMFEEVDGIANENGTTTKSTASGSTSDMNDGSSASLNLNLNTITTSLSENAESEAAENSRLRKQVSQLTDECARLRESELRLRRMQPSGGDRSDDDKSQHSSTLAQAAAPNFNTQTLLLVVIVALVIGVLVGKQLF